MQTYSKKLNRSRQIRLTSDRGRPDLAEIVLRRACDDIQQDPHCLPLWAYRLCQWVNRGRLGYQEVWLRLKCAALSGGASESWVDRCLYRSFGDTIAQRSEPMPLNVLAGGLH